MSIVDPSDHQDGRRRRSQRTREKMLDALAAAISQQNADLTPESIAARAGVSLSTLFRHFGDVAGLARAMRERVAVRVLPLLSAEGFEGDTRARVAELTRRRAELFEAIAPLRRVSLPREPGREPMQKRFLTAMQNQLRAAVGPELSGRNATIREDAIDAMLSVGAWSHLREVRGLDPKAAHARLEHATLQLLG